MSNASALLLSLKPCFADAIFSGEKRFELRRVKPRLVGGDLVVVYVTVPRCKLEGAFEVEQVIAATPNRLWRDVQHSVGVTKAEFDAYFDGADIGYGIEIRKVWKMEPITLAAMRRLRIRPPQSYQYLTSSTASRLTQGGNRSRKNPNSWRNKK